MVGTDVGPAEIDPVLHGVLLTYAEEHRDTFGGMWLDREAGGTMVLAFTDDPDAHLAALATRRPSPTDVHAQEPPPSITDDRPIGEWGVPFDVVQVTYTEDELVSAIGRVTQHLQDGGFRPDGAGADLMRNRVNIMLSTPVTPAGVDELTRTLAADPAVPLAIVCLEGEVVDAVAEPVQPGATLDAITLPDPAGTYPPDTAVECGGAGFRLGALTDPVPLEAGDPGLRAVLDAWLAGPEGAAWPQDGWIVLADDGDTAQLVSVGPDGAAFVGAERGRNGWIWSGASSSGACDVNLTLPEGLGSVTWELDPGFPPLAPESTELHVLATERACTGGSELGERLLGPQVVETGDAVRITFAAVPLTGGQTCPGNPATPVTIELAVPLGDRQVRDGLLVAPITELVDS